MIIFWIILIILMVILLYHKVKLNIDFSILGFDYYFCIRVHYFWDLFTIYKEDVMKYKNRNKNQMKMKEEKWILPYIKIERVIFKVKIGAGDTFVTSMLVPLFSTVSAIFLQKFLPQSAKNFSVHPVFNRFFFSMKGTTYLSIPLKDLIYIFFYSWWKKEKITRIK